MELCSRAAPGKDSCDHIERIWERLLTPQTGTLSGLLTLSDTLPKLDSQFTQTVSKTLDTLRSLTDDEKLSQHARINDRPVDEALMQWKWDRGRWGDGGKVTDVVEALTKVS